MWNLVTLEKCLNVNDQFQKLAVKKDYFFKSSEITRPYNERWVSYFGLLYDTYASRA